MHARFDTLALRSRIDTPAAFRVGTAMLLTLQAIVLFWIAAVHFPSFDEVGHLPSGILHWTEGRFEFYRVNPPLIRLIAAVPVVAFGPDFAPGNTASAARPEFAAGAQFATENYDRLVDYFAWSRWMLIPLILGGGYVAALWSRDLYGPAAGLTTLALWSLNPIVLAYGASMTPDAGAAAVGVIAAFVAARWQATGSWTDTAVVGVLVGLAVLAKSTWLVFAVLVPATWLVSSIATSKLHRSDVVRGLLQLVAIGVVGVLVVNLGYGFAGTLRPLGAFEFQSKLLGGEYSMAIDSHGNRFAHSALARVPVPLPADFVQGIDYLRGELEQGDRSFLFGEWRHGGWWHYYLCALALKSSMAEVLIWLLALATLCLRFVPLPTTGASFAATPRYKELLVVLPAAAVILAVSSQTGFNHHVRYVLPAIPFLQILAGRLMVYPSAWARGAVAACIGVSAVSSLGSVPHQHAFFNEIATIARPGVDYLSHSNVDWAQDINLLVDWIADHPEAKDIQVDTVGNIPVELGGLRAIDKTIYYTPSDRTASASAVGVGLASGPRPGWYAISRRRLQGALGSSFWGKSPAEYAADASPSYFRFVEPVASIGETIDVYCLGLEEANRLRLQLGLPPLDDRASTTTKQPTDERRVHDG